MRAFGPSLIALGPSVALLAMPRPPFDEGGNGTYLRYKAVWGGNPNEVFTHFLDLVLMSGNVAVLSVLLVWEACVRERAPPTRQQPIFLKAATVLGLGASGLVGAGLDMTHGEGPIIIVYPLLFLPMLLAGRALLRKLAERVGWKVTEVALVAALFTLVHAALQYFYEPSVTGSPNVLFVPLWVASLGFLVVGRRRHR